MNQREVILLLQMCGHRFADHVIRNQSVKDVELYQQMRRKNGAGKLLMNGIIELNSLSYVNFHQLIDFINRSHSSIRATPFNDLAISIDKNKNSIDFDYDENRSDGEEVTDQILIIHKLIPIVESEENEVVEKTSMKVEYDEEMKKLIEEICEDTCNNSPTTQRTTTSEEEESMELTANQQIRNEEFNQLMKQSQYNQLCMGFLQTQILPLVQKFYDFHHKIVRSPQSPDGELRTITRTSEEQETFKLSRFWRHIFQWKEGNEEKVNDFMMMEFDKVNECWWLVPLVRRRTIWLSGQITIYGMKYRLMDEDVMELNSLNIFISFSSNKNVSMNDH
ncbi:hypothetical protein SNEBB_001331 [Seison nebaliae]|nr:hypothetical protein SNEBB_001331 [Seison nebaliae]